MRMIRSLFVLAVCAAFLSPAYAKNSDVYQFTKTYPSPAGTVTFAHDRHAETYARDCAFCHAALKVFGGSVNKLFAHNFCNSCHLQRTADTNENCDRCHKQSIELSLN